MKPIGNKSSKNQKGSATVEAVVSFAGFLFVIFTILNIVNFCRAQMLISNAMDTVTKELTQYSYFYQVSGLQKFDQDIQAIGEEGALNLNTVAGSVGDLYSAMGTALETTETEATGLVNSLNDGSITSQSVNTALQNVQADGTNILTSINQMEAQFANVADNPVLYLKSIVAVAGSEGLELVKSHAIAAPLAKALMIKHFGGSKDEANAQLESLGVVGGLDGMNFGMSTIFTKEHPDEIHLSVYYKLKVVQLFEWADFEAYMCKESRARAWLGGDDVIKPAVVTASGGGGETPPASEEENTEEPIEEENSEENTEEVPPQEEEEVPEDGGMLELGAGGLAVLYYSYQDASRDENCQALLEIIAELNAGGGATPEEQEILKEWAIECGLDYETLGVIDKESNTLEENRNALYLLVEELNERGGATPDEKEAVEELAAEYGLDYATLGLIERDEVEADATSNLLKNTTCNNDELYRYLLIQVGSDEAEAYLNNGKWPEGQQIPINSSALNADGTINWDKAPQNGYVLDENGNAIKEAYKPEIGDIIDRYGPSNGRFTSPVLNGNSFEYTERSLPYVEDSSQYHQYEVVGDFSRIEEYVKNCKDAKVKAEIEDNVQKYYDGDYSKIIVYKGTAAKVDGWGDGGAIQYELPLTVEQLISLGILKEIK